MLGEECSDIRAGAEERRMPERYDAAVTEDQVERDGEQRKDRDFVEQRRVARCDEPHRQRAEPYGDLPRTHPRAGGGRLCRSRHQRAPIRANKPCGRTISTAIITQYMINSPSFGT